jgi:hypothetical protein
MRSLEKERKKIWPLELEEQLTPVDIYTEALQIYRENTWPSNLKTRQTEWFNIIRLLSQAWTIITLVFMRNNCEDSDLTLNCRWKDSISEELRIQKCSYNNKTNGWSLYLWYLEATSIYLDIFLWTTNAHRTLRPRGLESSVLSLLLLSVYCSTLLER